MTGLQAQALAELERMGWPVLQSRDGLVLDSEDAWRGWVSRADGLSISERLRDLCQLADHGVRLQPGRSAAAGNHG